MNKEKRSYFYEGIIRGHNILKLSLGFEDQGGQCVVSSEWNKFSQKTYLANFQDSASHRSAGDITRVDEKYIPDHDVLLAGFPCQPLSIAGVSKKNALGRPHGFECTTQGTLVLV